MWINRKEFENFKMRIDSLEMSRDHFLARSFTDNRILMDIDNSEGKSVYWPLGEVIKTIMEYLKINVIKEDAKLIIKKLKEK